MSGERVEIKTEDGLADGYLARPADDDGRRLGLLFLVDAFGLRPQIEQMAERISRRGFVVLAPNVFYRHGHAPVLPMPDLENPEERAPFMEKLRPMMQELTPELIASDSQGYLDFLAGVARAPFAITGYCMGARLGWRIATSHPDRVTALAGFHGGGLVTDDGDSLHHSASELTVEVYLGHADNDPSMSPENIAALERALDEAEVTYRSEVYAGAAHGYTMADTSMYDEGAAERHFERGCRLPRCGHVERALSNIQKDPRCASQQPRGPSSLPFPRSRLPWPVHKPGSPPARSSLPPVSPCGLDQPIQGTS